MLGINRKSLLVLALAPLVWGVVTQNNEFGIIMSVLATVVLLIVVVLFLGCFESTRRLTDEPVPTVHESHVLPCKRDIMDVDKLARISDVVFTFAPDGYKIPRSSRNMRCIGIMEHMTIIDYMKLFSVKARYYHAKEAALVDKLMDRITTVVGHRMEKYPLEGWEYPTLRGELARLSDSEFPFVLRIERNKIYIRELTN
jgi:hypothetical protein